MYEISTTKSLRIHSFQKSEFFRSVFDPLGGCESRREGEERGWSPTPQGLIMADVGEEKKGEEAYETQAYEALEKDFQAVSFLFLRVLPPQCVLQSSAPPPPALV